MESNQFDVMEETCKAKAWRVFKAPSQKRAPLITGKDERQRAYRGDRGAPRLSGLCTTLCSCLPGWACSLLCVFGAFAQDGRHQPLLLPQSRWDWPGLCSNLSLGTAPASDGVWVVAGQKHGSSQAWVALAGVQELRRAAWEPRLHWAQTLHWAQR